MGFLGRLKNSSHPSVITGVTVQWLKNRLYYKSKMYVRIVDAALLILYSICLLPWIGERLNSCPAVVIQQV